MRTLHRVLFATSAALLATTQSTIARAQLDVEPPMPNVMLVLDTSASMEEMPVLGKVYPTCAPGEPLHRWAALVKALTGEIQNYSCSTVSRKDAAFLAEYSYKGGAPADYGATVDYHRMASNGCTPTKGVEPNKWWEWPDGAIRFRPMNDVNGTCSTWSQKQDGALDLFGDRIRFGMMTFDSFYKPNTGGYYVDGSIYPTDGAQGMWSYYLNWAKGTGTPRMAFVPNNPPVNHEVGARNQAAPPWEGPLIGFGPSDATLADVQKNNDRIQQAIIAVRPYGSTPLAGQMDDAKDFLLNEESIDPNTGKPFGPKDDPLYLSGCRKQYLIVLSDGEPNLDYRDKCDPSWPGSCPYPLPDETASYLSSLGSTKAIQTFVIGFAVEDQTALAALGRSSCSELTTSDCASAPAELAGCCTLNKLALAGGSQRAYFARNDGDLRKAFLSILSSISSPSSRTIPIFASAVAAGAQGNASAAAYRFVARFRAKTTDLWTGELLRQRFVCTTQNGKLTPVEQEPEPSVGDDFSANLNSNDASNPRRFMTIIGPSSGGTIPSHQSIRPGITTDDGLGTYGSGAGTSIVGPSTGTVFATTLSGGSNPQAMGIDPLSPPGACSTTLKATTASDCVQSLIRWEVGETAVAPLTATRDPGKEFGAVFHSTPVVVGPPREGLSDETYTQFAIQQSKRPLMLYTATLDGQLHAFKVAAGDPSDAIKVDKVANNELWSFIPPGVLPNLLGAYDQQVKLLDGAPVVADTVFERSSSKPAVWKTVLVAGSGATSSANGFYYALDVTDPTTPKFLWQLSTDTSNVPLFGASTGRPAIATIALPDGAAGLKEVAVAILPGGTGTVASGACARDNSTSLMKSGSYTARAQVRCWNPGPSRSLTIVRLDTGEVLMNFRAAANEGPAGLSTTKYKVAPFTSPITGVPAAYPGRTGQVANRVYVGDADGNLWRIDMSSTDPQKWEANLAWDAYSVSWGDDWSTGEPIQTEPLISTTPLGDTVVLFSTGDQEQLTPNATMSTRLWSVTEKWNGGTSKYEVKDNYYKYFTGGERVTGAMALFDSSLYFSTFSPPNTGSTCSYGASKVWALDYLTASPRFPDPVTPGVFKAFVDAPETIILGVSVTRTPSCTNLTTVNDPYFGNYSYLGDGGGGTYQVLWQKGSGKGVAGTGVNNDPFTGIQSVNLATPQQLTRIDAWASVVE